MLSEEKGELVGLFNRLRELCMSHVKIPEIIESVNCVNAINQKLEEEG